jgi:methyl acetate hydrolase
MKYLLAFIFCNIPVLLASAQTLSPAGINALDSYLANAIGSTRIPGMVALVTNGDEIIYERAFGLMDTANSKKMTTDAIFRLASMTKAITSAGIMQLVEDGKVALDAPVSAYLPDLHPPGILDGFDENGFVSHVAGSEMTVRQLLTHTSGLGYTFTSEFLNRFQATTPDNRATELPLLFEPGTSWQYGESTRVLGEIIEAVSGQELSAYLDEHLLAPLGMTDTGYDIPATRNGRVVTVHRFDGTTLNEVPNPAGVISSPHQGDGGLSGTAADYAKFIRLFLNGGMAGPNRLLDADTVQTMGQNHTAPVSVGLMKSTNKLTSEDFPLGAGVDSYGLGFQRTESQVPGMRSVGSLAWAGIYNTEFWIDPDKNIGAVLLMQYLPFYDADAIKVLQGFEQRIYANLQE